MALFEVTGIHGEKFTVNTETIKFCEPYDHATMRDDLLHAKIIKGRQSGDLDGGLETTEVSDELRATFKVIGEFQTKIHFTDRTWRAVWETPEEVRNLANKALSELMSHGDLPKAQTPKPSFTPSPKPAP